MRVGISQADADSTVSSLSKWVSWLVDIITTLRNFLSSIGLLDGETQA